VGAGKEIPACGNDPVEGRLEGLFGESVSLAQNRSLQLFEAVEHEIGVVTAAAELKPKVTAPAVIPSSRAASMSRSSSPMAMVAAGAMPS